MAHNFIQDNSNAVKKEPIVSGYNNYLQAPDQELYLSKLPVKFNDLFQGNTTQQNPENQQNQSYMKKLDS